MSKTSDPERAPTDGLQGLETIKTSMTTDVEHKKAAKRVVTLGSVRHRNEHTGEIILIPTPSKDPNDPLNWSQPKKYYSAFIICLAMMICNFLAAGPTIAIVETAMEFFPDWNAHGPAGLGPAINKTAFFFTTTALLQGTGNLIWMPLVNKYGRRPVYLISYTIYLACAIWAACTKGYGSFLAARILMGFGSGAAETMAPLSIADIFFLHERGTIMAMYSCALVSGVSGGIIVSGLITINHPWRYIYYVAIALVGLTLVLAFFTFPETVYQRSIIIDSDNEPSIVSKKDVKHKENNESSSSSSSIPRKKTYLETLQIFSGKYTEESFWKLFMRPFGLILLPPVLWTSLVQSVTIGFIVAVTSNVASAYSTAYGMKPYQTGLCFFAAIIGALVGIFCGGYLGDKTADFLTKRNGGIREPEMRLPAMMFSLISTPLSLILYGVGIQYKLHWMCPTVGLALLNFSIVQGTNVALVYTIDAYRPIAGEVTLTTMGFKSAFGFLLSFYTNPWIEKSGYLNAYGAMAGISALVLIFWVPLYVWGKRVRHATWNWSVIKSVHWDEDREVGE